MTVEEPRVTSDDRAWMLALDQYEDGLCRCGCGFPASVSLSPDNEGRFVMEPPFRCHARTAMVRAEDEFGDDVPQQRALLWESPTLRSG